MINLKYIGLKTLYQVSFNPCGDHTVQIMGDLPAKTNGFELYRSEDNMLLGQYDGYTTVYQVLEGGVVFSDNGSVYVPPEPVPDPEPVPPYVPTLEEIREQKVQAMNTIQQAMIAAGVDVTLSDGTSEHFTLTEHDQSSLTGLQTQVLAGVEQLPWHTSDEDKHCKFYSNADMTLIVSAAMQYVIWHVSYFRDLRIYIRSLDDVEAVEAVTYGMDLPEAYQSDPLKAMLARGVA